MATQERQEYAAQLKREMNCCQADSVVGYADYAVAMVDEAMSAAPHVAQRISVVRK